LQADWAVSFEMKRTSDASFKRQDGSVVKVPMMVGGGEFGYADADAYQLVKLPLKDKQLAMLLWLPKDESDGLLAMEKGMSFEGMLEVMRKMNLKKLNVTLPRFRSRYREGLADALKAMGVKKAFAAGHLDFETIGKDQNGQGLALANVFHFASVRVDEMGCHAQARSGEGSDKEKEAVEARDGSKQLALAKVEDGVSDVLKEVRFDRPFVFAIQHQASGAFLLMGRVTDPLR
jgi:serpin B